MYSIEQEAIGYQAACYCDEFALKPDGDLLYASICGSAMSVKAIVAQIIGKRKVQLFDLENEKLVLNAYGLKLYVTRTEGNIIRMTSRIMLNHVVHRILYSENMFMPWLHPGMPEFLAYGETEDCLPAMAFKIINKFTSVPLKASWADWLWDRITEINGEPLITSEERSPCFRFCQTVRMPNRDMLQNWITEDLENLKHIGADDHECCNLASA